MKKDRPVGPADQGVADDEAIMGGPGVHAKAAFDATPCDELSAHHFEAQAEGMEPDNVLLEILDKLPEKAEESQAAAATGTAAAAPPDRGDKPTSWKRRLNRPPFSFARPFTFTNM